jgi:hypothetical protein
MTGFGSVTTNFPATVQNTVLEFSLTTTPIKAQQFMWNSTFNLTIPRNKLQAFPGLENSSYSSQLIIGQPISIVKVYDLVGIDPATGLYQFLNAQGNATSSPNVTDQTIVINTSPKFYGGFQNSFNYKGFQLDLLFQFTKQVGVNSSLGNSLYSSNQPGFRLLNQPSSVMNRWQKDKSDGSVQKFSSDNFNAFFSYFYATVSDGVWSDASFVRLKNLSFSYQLPLKWQQKARLKSCKLFLSGQNLLTITDYDGMDPENRGSLPPLRVVTLGVRVGL